MFGTVPYGGAPFGGQIPTTVTTPETYVPPESQPPRWPRVPLLNPEDPLNSRHLRWLATAWNARLRSGVGDCAWRLTMYWMNLFRQVRNPSGGLFPAQHEFFNIYQHIDPATGITWPDTGPGEEEGANLANPMMQFVFGVNDLPGEADRLAGVPLKIDGHEPRTLSEHWELSKHQRGAVDPKTGAQFWPVGEAAQNFMRIATPWYSPHGKSYGGYFPSPQTLLDNCGATIETGLYIPSYRFKFTALRPDVEIPAHHGTLDNTGATPVVYYAGSCPCWTTSHASGHVVGIGRFPMSYWVWVSQGDAGCTADLDKFPVQDWIEGPYDGDGVLQRADGYHLSRAMWGFAMDFRGSTSQRGGHALLGALGQPGSGSDAFGIEEIAFPWQEFLTRQYALAPARGVQVADQLLVDYPSVQFSGPNQARNAMGKFKDGRPRYNYADGFTCAGLFARAEGLRESTTVEFLSGDEVIATLALSPDDSGAAEAMRWLETAVRPDPLQIRLPDGARFRTSAGKIVAEATELQEYKPQWWDGALAVRLGGTHGVFGTISAGVDGRGLDLQNAPEIGAALLQRGCIVNQHGVDAVRAQAEWVTDNPGYDAARRMSRDQMRIARREALVGYEVKEGKSILYFKRFAYGMHNSRLDLFDGIAPPIDPVASGALIEEEIYLVRSASGSGYIRRGGRRYGDGQTFTADSDLTYQVVGDAQVFVHDGIRHTARPKGWTNEWVMFVETKCYRVSPSSIWKPEAYSDYWPYCQRCLFYGEFVGSSAFRRHVSYHDDDVGLDDDYFPYRLPGRVQTYLTAPEAPTGYRYGRDSNRYYASTEFKRSCQVYEAPAEIESCTVEDWVPNQVIKVVLKQRVKTHPDAPADVPRNPLDLTAAQRSALAAETYRTPDNALREYCLHIADNSYNCSQKVGDTGTRSGSGVFGNSDSPYGSCYPTVFLVHLVPEPYEDNNDELDDWDSRCTVDPFMQMETLTRACCEGFVDSRTSLELICERGSGGLYDYTFENLCYDAFGGRWIGAMSLADRPEHPAGHGPLPNTDMHAEVYNRLAQCVNLLDKARLDFPVQFQVKRTRYTGSRPVTPVGDTCGGGAAWLDGASLPACGTYEASGSDADYWESGSAAANYFGSLACGTPSWTHVVLAERTLVDWRVMVTSEWIDAVPDELQDLINESGAGVICTRQESVGTAKRVIVGSLAESKGCGTPPPSHPFQDDDENWLNWVDTGWTETSCVLMAGGILEADPPPPSDLALGWEGLGTCDESSGRWVSLTPLDLQGAFIQVPLEDPQ